MGVHTHLGVGDYYIFLLPVGRETLSVPSVFSAPKLVSDVQSAVIIFLIIPYLVL